MMTAVNQLLGLGTIVLQILIVMVVVYYLWCRASYDKLHKFFNDYSLWIAFLIALIATLGSLFYSEIAGFAPCDLCWLQRIAIYPQVFLLGMAAYRRDALVKFYSLPLLGAGLLLTLYHNYIYYNPPAVTMCTATSASCTNKVVTIYGYVSIPLMALTVIVAMILLILIARPKQ